MNRKVKIGLVVLCLVILWIVTYVIATNYLDNKVNKMNSTKSSLDNTPTSKVKIVKIDGTEIEKVNYSNLNETFKVEVTYEDGSTIEKNAYVVKNDKIAKGIVKYEDLNNKNGRIVISNKEGDK